MKPTHYLLKNWWNLIMILNLKISIKNHFPADVSKYWTWKKFNYLSVSRTYLCSHDLFSETYGAHTFWLACKIMVQNRFQSFIVIFFSSKTFFVNVFDCCHRLLLTRFYANTSDKLTKISFLLDLFMQSLWLTISYSLTTGHS